MLNILLDILCILAIGVIVMFLLVLVAVFKKIEETSATETSIAEKAELEKRERANKERAEEFTAIMNYSIDDALKSKEER